MKKKSFIGCLLAVSLLCMSGCGGGGDSQASVSNHREDKNYYFSFGVYGDPQVGADDSPQDYSVNSEKAIRMTMEYFQKEGMDAIVSVGDVIDYCEYNGLPGTAYDKFNEILDEVFGERDENGVRTEAPIMLHTLGNHEFSGFNHTDSASWYWDYSGEAAVDIFCEKLNTELIQVYENYGYTIITANMSECRGKFSDESKQKIEAALKTASADDPWRPIFMTTHYVPQDTIYHSDWISDDDAWLSNLLKQYPQVILFTGHTHNPLNDPRIISQKDYNPISYVDYGGYFPQRYGDWLVVNKNLKFRLNDKEHIHVISNNIEYAWYRISKKTKDPLTNRGLNDLPKAARKALQKAGVPKDYFSKTLYGGLPRWQEGFSSPYMLPYQESFSIDPLPRWQEGFSLPQTNNNTIVTIVTVSAGVFVIVCVVGAFFTGGQSLWGLLGLV